MGLTAGHGGGVSGAGDGGECGQACGLKLGVAASLAGEDEGLGHNESISLRPPYKAREQQLSPNPSHTSEDLTDHVSMAEAKNLGNGAVCA